jgi:hypothetical protein
MSVALKIIDQTLGVHPRITRELRLVSERITLRELLERRINEEVAELNAGADAIQPLITPTHQEKQLNDKVSPPRQVDPVRQLAAAAEAFERRRIVIIVGERQILNVDEPLIITADREVRFIKLVPLVGG